MVKLGSRLEQVLVTTTEVTAHTLLFLIRLLDVGAQQLERLEFVDTHAADDVVVGAEAT